MAVCPRQNVILEGFCPGIFSPDGNMSEGLCLDTTAPILHVDRTSGVDRPYNNSIHIWPLVRSSCQLAAAFPDAVSASGRAAVVHDVCRVQKLN